MRRKLSAVERIELLKRAQSGQKVAALCREFGVSRAFFYKIRARYKATGDGPYSLERKIPKVVSPRRVSQENQRLILVIVRDHPDFSSKKISKVLTRKNGKPIVGNHGVQNVLARLELSNYQQRLEYAKGKREIAAEFEAKSKGKLTTTDRLSIIRRVEQGEKVAPLCRQYGISRTVFYRFLKRYRQTQEQIQRGEMDERAKIASLSDRPPIPKHFWRLTTPEIEKKVLEIVAGYPGLSAHKIVEVLPQVQNKPILSNKGVQNVLRRHNLSTFEQRLAYSRLAEKVWKPRWTVADIPTIPLHIWRMLYAPFATIPKLGWLFTRGQLLFLFTFIVGFYFFQLISAIAQGQIGPRIGIFFASVSLTFGIFFFLYSLKYYLSILLVLRLAQFGMVQTGGSIASGGKGEKSAVSRLLSRLGWKLPTIKVFPIRDQKRVNPLLVNLDRVKLDSQKPFVSIHVALYNEKRVVERLIRACTSQNWFCEGSSGSQVIRPSGSNPSYPNTRIPNNQSANYELIIVDDSTDETTEILKGFLKGNQGRLREIKGEQGEMIYKFIPDNPSFPSVTLIHRQNRSGFKGGALQEALENTDERAEYITVFDADFIPYPDTIEQFAKTFQVLTGSQVVRVSGSQEAALPDNPNTRIPDNQNIAAVQGYQWHVLNKSQTWVTRGVRTEYAGSYVIERSGAQIYGGLKQIAGAVYAIRADILRAFGWGTSITEDFELTLRLYEAGYKVAFTPYIQAPAEAVSTIRRLIRQRMRWAEGASFNVKCMFRRMLFGRWVEASSGNGNEASYVSGLRQTLPNTETGLVIDNHNPKHEGKVWVPSRLTLAEKLEFAYLAPYYLQAAFLVIGTLSWFASEAILGARLPFWTAALGWSLVFTNLLALPLMNIIGLFLEESEERDYFGVLSFIALSYIVVPFQAYAAIKGFLEPTEGPWFRTPKTGIVTDVFGRPGFGKFFGNLFGRPATVEVKAQWSNGQMVNNLAMEQFNNSNLVLARAYNHFGGNLKIRPRQIRWLGNLVLGLIIAISVLMSVFAPVIPYFSNAYAEGSERKLSTIAGGDGNEQRNVAVDSVDGEISNPMATSYPLGGGKTLEYIFHPEPRVRTKIDGKELEVKFEGFEGLDFKAPKKSIKEDKQYKYEGIYDGIDMRYDVNGNRLTEEVVLSKYQDIRALKYSLQGVDIEGIAGEDKEIYFASKEGGEPLFTLTKPYLYEERNPHDKFFGIEYQLEKTPLGWDLKKVLTEEGRNWLADPGRVFPVIIDPTQVVGTIATGISTTEARYGSVQRKVAYMPNATGGAAWYAVYENGTDVFWEKSTNGSTWTGTATDVDTGDSDNETPSVWKEGDVLWIAWFDNSLDVVEFVPLNTATDGLGTQCSPTVTSTTADSQVTIALTDNGNIYTALTNPADTELFVLRTLSGGCTTGDITSGSGLTANDPVDLVTAGNNVYMIYNDGDLSASIYGDDGSGAWDTSNQDINGATASNSDGDFSVATDGTDIWIVQATTTSGTESFRCADCVSDPTSPVWADIAEPYASQSNGSYVSVGYISTGNVLVAMYMTGTGTGEVINWETSDADTIFWSGNSTFAFTPQSGGMDTLSSTMIVTSDTQFGAVSDEVTATDLEFSTLPENLWVLLLTIPFWPKVFGKMKKKRRR